MTDDQSPERPDFEPPEGGTYGSFPAPPPDSDPVVPGSEAPTAPPGYWPPPPPPPPPAPLVVPPPPQVILPPGPYKKPWPPPPRPPRERGGKGSILLGMGITLATLAISWFLSAGVSYDDPLYPLTNGAIVLAPVLLIVVGIILAAIHKTTRTGAGILLGLGAAVLIAGGLCIALLASYSS